jgi:hypothetical protein
MLYTNRIGYRTVLYTVPEYVMVKCDTFEVGGTTKIVPVLPIATATSVRNHFHRGVSAQVETSVIFWIFLTISQIVKHVM